MPSCGFASPEHALVPGCAALCRGNNTRLQERQISANTKHRKIKRARPVTD